MARSVERVHCDRLTGGGNRTVDVAGPLQDHSASLVCGSGEAVHDGRVHADRRPLEVLDGGPEQASRGANLATKIEIDPLRVSDRGRDLAVEIAFRLVPALQLAQAGHVGEACRRLPLLELAPRQGDRLFVAPLGREQRDLGLNQRRIAGILLAIALQQSVDGLTLVEVDVAFDQVKEDDLERRIDLECAREVLPGGAGVRVAAEVGVDLAEDVVGVGNVVGRLDDFHQRPERGVGLADLVVHRCVVDLLPALGQTVHVLEALPAGLQRDVAIAVPAVRHGQAVPGQREGRILLDGHAELSRRLRPVSGVQRTRADREVPKRFGGLGQRFLQLDRRARRSDAHTLPHVGGDRAGQREQLGRRRHVPRQRSQRAARRYVHQFRRQQQLRAVAHHLTHEHHVDAGLLRRGFGVRSGETSAAGALARREDLCRRDDFETSTLREVGGDEAHQHAAEMLAVVGVVEILDADHAEGTIREHGVRSTGSPVRTRAHQPHRDQGDHRDQGQQTRPDPPQRRRGSRFACRRRERRLAGLDLLAQLLQLVAHVQRGLVATVDGLLEAASDDPAEVPRSVSFHLGQGDRSVLQDRGQG